MVNNIIIHPCQISVINYTRELSHHVTYCASFRCRTHTRERSLHGQFVGLAAGLLIPYARPLSREPRFYHNDKRSNLGGSVSVFFSKLQPLCQFLLRLGLYSPPAST